MDKELLKEIEEVYQSFEETKATAAASLTIAYYIGSFLKFFEEAKKEHDAQE